MRLRIFDQARTAHLERLAREPAPPIFVYRRVSYDFDDSLAASLGTRKLGILRTALLLIRNSISILELNEPLFMATWPLLILYISCARVGGFIRRRRPRIVCYAIENIDTVSQFQSYTKLPERISRWIAVAITRVLLANYDRIAFGTAASYGAYSDLCRDVLQRIDTNTFTGLDCPCGHCSRPKSGPSVIFVGAFEARKGLPQLLQAWPVVVREHPTARLTLAGKGPLFTQIAVLTKHSPTVSIVVDPSREAIHQLLAESNVLVLLSQPQPRWKEQIGLPILEGLSHGCEIITTTETGMAAWLSTADHRVMAPQAKTEEIAAAISHALANPRSPELIKSMLPTVDSRMVANDWLWEAACN